MCQMERKLLPPKAVPVDGVLRVFPENIFSTFMSGYVHSCLFFFSLYHCTSVLMFTPRRVRSALCCFLVPPLLMRLAALFR